ncbi:hypothetical protein NQZ79_g5108 [Umbelopsis isabellina]|nr:hypothetical protein NQZ79_g5108 [Umbelopsis isabellina]
MEQHPPCAEGANGSSDLGTGPQTEGKSGSWLSLQYAISLRQKSSLVEYIQVKSTTKRSVYPLEASEMVTRGILSCCSSRALYSSMRFSLVSDRFCTLFAIPDRG